MHQHFHAIGAGVVFQRRYSMMMRGIYPEPAARAEQMQEAARCFSAIAAESIYGRGLR